MNQSIDLWPLLGYLQQQFFHIPVIAYTMMGLMVFFGIAWLWGVGNQTLTTPSRFAPSVMTAAGLMGTFIGLTYGMQDLSLNDKSSMQALIDGLKSVFVYSLAGVFSAIVFMLLNMIPAGLERRKNNQRKKELEHAAQGRTEQWVALQKVQISHQQAAAEALQKLKIGFDPDSLAQKISAGLNPALQEIRAALADQGGEAIRQVLENLRAEILHPMKTALDNTNDAVLKTVDALNESQQHTDRLVKSVGEAADKMQKASADMQTLVGSIGDTVNHMAQIQREQHASLTRFNDDLQENLAKIEPAIAEGMSKAEGSLTSAVTGASGLMTTAIGDASTQMRDSLKQAGEALNNTVQQSLIAFGTTQEHLNNILNGFSGRMDGHIDRMNTELEATGQRSERLINEASMQMQNSLKQAGDELNRTVGDALEKFGDTQTKLDGILVDFSGRMDGHIGRMNTELEATGQRSERLINGAADNLKATLGDIDRKLLNTSEVLQGTLETFRKEYQERLTEFLEGQNEQMGQFLKNQNEQLEETLGKQREGLVIVVNLLSQQFELMSKEQNDINNKYGLMVRRLDEVQSTLMPRVSDIARELGSGDQKLSRMIEAHSTQLQNVSEALQKLGGELPAQITTAYETLNHKYKEAFSELDGGIADAAEQLTAATNQLVQGLTAVAAVKA